MSLHIYSATYRCIVYMGLPLSSLHFPNCFHNIKMHDSFSADITKCYNQIHERIKLDIPW